jgi:hypothetical protein
MEKPAPVMEAELTVTAEVPVEVRVTVLAVAEFSVTLPKATVVLLTDNCGLDAAVPAPLRETTEVLPVDELLLIESWPATEPEAVGLN